VAVSTALPTIVADLHISQFLWVASAYGLTSAAFLPLSGGLAEVCAVIDTQACFLNFILSLLS
jgi:MFS family permease